MIPDEAVAAAMNALIDEAYRVVRWDEIRKALEAAAPHMLAEAWDEGRRGGLLFPQRFDNPYRTQP